MPKVSPEHLESRRNQILDAATACFARHGVRETTIQKICAEAGLSAGAVYRYFDGKQQILEAVYERSIVENRGMGEELAGAHDPVAALRGLVGGMVDFLADPARTQEHQLSIRVHAEGLSDPEVARAYTAVHRDVIEQLTPLVEALRSEGHLPSSLDVEYFLWVFVTAYQGLRVHKMLDPDIDLERFRAALLALLDAMLAQGNLLH